MLRRLAVAGGGCLVLLLLLRPAPRRAQSSPAPLTAASALPAVLGRARLPERPADASAAPPQLQPQDPSPAGARDGYTFWSTDYHIAPVADMADVFASLCATGGGCMRIEEHSFSGACGRTFGGRRPSCAQGLRVLDKGNAFDLCPRPHALRRRFFDAYCGPRSALQHVDAFVCNHPPALCELYMPFNKSLLVFATVNLEFSRENPERWAEWLQALRHIARDRWETGGRRERGVLL